MTALHEYLQTYINDLQQLLGAYPEEDALIKAVEQKWLANDLRRDFVIAAQTETDASGGRKDLKSPLHRIGDMGGEENEGRENIPIGIKDMGGEETGDDGRENVLVGKTP
jgi:hypothetical protein